MVRLVVDANHKVARTLVFCIDNHFRDIILGGTGHQEDCCVVYLSALCNGITADDVSHGPLIGVVRTTDGGCLGRF